MDTKRIRKILGIVDIFFVGTFLVVAPLPLLMGFAMSFDSPYTTLAKVFLYLGVPVIFMVVMVGLIGAGGIMLLFNKESRGSLLAGIGCIPYVLFSLVLVIQSQISPLFVVVFLILCAACFLHFYLFAKSKKSGKITQKAKKIS